MHDAEKLEKKTASLPVDRSRDRGFTEYFGSISGTSRLTFDEERDLAEAASRGEADAREMLIRANMPLVTAIARGFLNRGLALEDLIGEGNLGLIRAAADFDPAYGVRFSTYAGHWIRHSIRLGLTRAGATIRLPARLVTLMGRWDRSEREMARELGRPPTFEEVAQSLGLDESQRNSIISARRAARVLGEHGEGKQAWTLDETPAPADPPDATLEADERRRELGHRLGYLDGTERTLIAMLYGLGTGEALPLAEAARRLGLAPGRARILQMRAEAKLRSGARPGGPLD